MASRSATVLVIFVIAVIAFCLASVFGAMTGTISILPNESEYSGGILDNLSAITDGTGDSGVSYGNEHSDYSGSSESNVETTVDDSGSSGSGGGTSPESPDKQGDSDNKDGDKKDDSHVETTTG